MQEFPQIYLTLHGVPVSEIEPNKEFFVQSFDGGWVFNKNNSIYEIENVCIKIHDSLAVKIFGNKEIYWSILPYLPTFLCEAGLNSESTFSRDLFNEFLQRFDNDEYINKALYLYDSRKLVSSIQEITAEVIQLQGEFYRILNLHQLFYPELDQEDGLYYVTSSAVTNLFAILGFIYIRLYSLLDYITKLAYEIEFIEPCFHEYPKLKSKNILYGQKKKIKFNNLKDSLFERCSLINEVETIRNHIIHDGFVDDMPKVYRVIKDKKIIEKYILLPDMDENRRLTTLKNRNLFYGGEDKINLRLPYLIIEFQKKLMVTLEAFYKELTE